jgi:hypothetical protein
VRADDNLTTIAPDAFSPGIHATVFTSRWHKIISGGTFLRVRSTLLTGPTEAALIEEMPPSA